VRGNPVCAETPCIRVDYVARSLAKRTLSEFCSEYFRGYTQEFDQTKTKRRNIADTYASKCLGHRIRKTGHMNRRVS